MVCIIFAQKNATVLVVGDFVNDEYEGTFIDGWRTAVRSKREALIEIVRAI